MRSLAAIIALLSLTTSAHAFGIGAYGGGSFNYGAYFDSTLPFSSNDNGYRGNLFVGGGLVIDTNCARNELFNYRISIGASRSFVITNSVKPENSTKISILNTFGFGVVRKETFRFWLGPRLGIHSLEGGYKRTTKDYVKIYFINGTPEINPSLALFDNKFRYSLFGASLGFAMGMNFNFTGNITLAIDTGFSFYMYYGMASHKGFIPFQYTGSNIYIPFTNNSWATRYAMEGTISMAILYRIEDSYSAHVPENDVK